MLFANLAACLVVALTGSFRGGVAGLPPALLLVMALIGSSMDVAGEALFVTTVATLAIGATATGALCILIGRFRLAIWCTSSPTPLRAALWSASAGPFALLPCR